MTALSAEMLEGTLPTRPEPEKSLQPEPSNRIRERVTLQGVTLRPGSAKEYILVILDRQTKLPIASGSVALRPGMPQ